MTANDIVKDLESVIDWFTNHGSNTNTAVIDISQRAIDVIEQQKAEIERLKKELHDCVKEVSRSHEIDRIIAIREFAERLKEMASQTFWESDSYVGTEQIDRLVQEMKEQ